jgi:hypothetical protein
MVTRIIWFSRHVPTRRQRTELESVFGTALSLEHDARAFDTADDVIARFRCSGATEMVVVAPDAVIRAIVRRGLQPIKARMELCNKNHPECEVTIQARSGFPRHYRHVCFERVLCADFKVESLTTTKPKEEELQLCS